MWLFLWWDGIANTFSRIIDLFMKKNHSFCWFRQWKFTLFIKISHNKPVTQLNIKRERKKVVVENECFSRYFFVCVFSIIAFLVLCGLKREAINHRNWRVQTCLINKSNNLIAFKLNYSQKLKQIMKVNRESFKLKMLRSCTSSRFCRKSAAYLAAIVGIFSS